jgi:hypothetical protein
MCVRGKCWKDWYFAPDLALHLAEFYTGVNGTIEDINRMATGELNEGGVDDKARYLRHLYSVLQYLFESAKDKLIPLLARAANMPVPPLEDGIVNALIDVSQPPHLSPEGRVLTHA